MERRRLRMRRREIRLCGLRRFGTIEMLGVQRRIAVAVPVGGGAMQLGAAHSGQRRVHAVADQRVREQELVALGADQVVRDEPVAA